MQELVLIFVLALIIVGPKQLPELARALGKGYAEFRRAFEDMKSSVEKEIRADELRRTLQDVAPPPHVGKPGSSPPTPYPEVVAPPPPPPPPPAASPAEGADEGRRPGGGAEEPRERT